MDVTNIISILINAGKNTQNNHYQPVVISEIMNILKGNINICNRNEFILMERCEQMLENYIHYFPAELGCVWFSNTNMEEWKTVYYEQLVKNGPKLLDDKFFNPNTFSNLGIGNDGAFNGYELFQFLYRINKAIYEFVIYNMSDFNIDKIISNLELLACAKMLENYIVYFPASDLVSFNNSDMKMWNEIFYPNLIKNDPELPDDKFFSDTDTHFGIGTDGAFNGYDLFQLLFRLYRKISKNIR